MKISTVTLGMASLFAAGQVMATNLVQDSSFEVGPRLWFQERTGGHLLRELVDDAPDGRFVLTIQGWRSGGIVLSPPLPAIGMNVAATAQVRMRGATPESSVEVELLLMDAEGKKPIASLGRVAAGEEWATLSGEAVLESEAGEGSRLGIRMTGKRPGGVVELDQVGLFAGTKSGDASNQAVAMTIDAVKLADGAAWEAISGDGGSMYFEPSFNPKILSGAPRIADSDALSVRYPFTVQHGGDYRLWVRHLRTDKIAGEFTLELHQNGAVVASQEFDSAVQPGTVPPWRWSWEGLSARLEPGEAELVLSRPAAASSAIARRIDRFYLTNITDYTPQDADFRTPIYARFINRSEGIEPFCLWLHVRRHSGPDWYANAGMLSHAGFNHGYAVPHDRALWLHPGDASPWVPLGDYILPLGGRNNLQWVATRSMHTRGHVTERLRGTLEFATGDERTVIRSIEIDQEAPRIWVALPGEIKEGSVMTGYDYLKESAKAIPANVKAPEGHLKNIEVSGHLGLRKESDDPALIREEVETLRRLGIDNTYIPTSRPESALEWNRTLGFPEVFGLSPISSPAFYAKGAAELEEHARAVAQENAPILDRVNRLMFADEPHAAEYPQLLATPGIQERFKAWLETEQKLTPEALGVASWDAVTLTPPEQKEESPELFYYTGLFRLHDFAARMKEMHRIFKKHFPPAALSAVNLSPAVFSGIADQQGHDEYLLYRNGGLDLMWTEDWPGYGVSPQQMASYLAMFRVAGRPEGKPLGGFNIPDADPVMQRVKMYIWLAEGVRMLNVYAYGPYYAGIDSWSTRYSAFPVIAEVGQEVRKLDPYLEGVVRRPSQIAILYNRTAGIWRDFAFNTEQDARYIHWALSHAGYDADFIPEEDVESGALEQYRLVYVNGVQLRQESAQRLADWVKAGGWLVGTSGAGTRDPFNRPMETLHPVFGIESQRLQLTGNAGRARYETRRLQSLGSIRSEEGGPLPAIGFDVLGNTEQLKPLPDARVVLKRSGNPAGILSSYGKGKALRLSVLPGLAYLYEAVKPGEGHYGLYQGFRKELRDFIAWPAKEAGVLPVAETNAAQVSVARWDHPERVLLYVINYVGEAAPDFRMVVPDLPGRYRASTLQGVPVEVQRRSDGGCEVAFPLNIADTLILEREADE